MAKDPCFFSEISLIKEVASNRLQCIANYMKLICHGLQ